MCAHHPHALPDCDGSGDHRADGTVRLRAIQPQGLGDELLVGHRKQHRPSGLDQGADLTGDLKRVICVLAEVLGGVDQQAILAHPGGQGRVGLTVQVRDRCGDDVVVADPVGIRSRRMATRVCAQVARTMSPGDSRQLGVVSCPGVVDEIRPRGTGGVGNVGPPGVDADHQIGMGGPDPGNKRHDPA